LSSDSYLNIKKIVSLCKKIGVKYVHPGWGFLSENYKFPQALEREGIVFIGPSVEAMKLMGDKLRSKKIAKEVGVSMPPSYDNVLEDIEKVEEIADNLGYPVILKAYAGGGGKGIRIIYQKDDLRNAFSSVRNEARNSFGDDRIFIEKYIEDPHHIEIQVIGDQHGNIVCLGERDCSIQRNLQKVVEESPCSIMDDRTRKKMYSQAVALCKKVGYYSAGTLEFLMDDNKNFYFLEMNTRLQVEHTVSEMVTGIDIVEQMIRIAQGEELPFKQQNIKLDGWAIECRINAEDPSRGFLPSSGRISKYEEPEKSDIVRIDSSVYEGYTVSMFYDSMIAKLIVHGTDRNDAIEKMQNALGSFFIDGISHNIPFLEAIMYNDNFKIGGSTTGFIKKEFSGGFAGGELNSNEEGVLIGTAIYMYMLNVVRLSSITGQLSQTYKVELDDKLVCDINNNKYLCAILKTEKGISVNYGTGFTSVETNWYFGDNIFRAEINGKPINVKINSDSKTGTMRLQYMGVTVNISIRNPRVSELEKYMPVKTGPKKPTVLKAPITGKIVKFMVEEGQEVKAGGELVVVEAMKMENVIRTDFDVKIKTLAHQAGELIGVGEVMIEFEY
jgi:propionyl-CoA carboxylase alpha chain